MYYTCNSFTVTVWLLQRILGRKLRSLVTPFSLFFSPLYNASLFPGLSMELGEMKGGCQYFYLEHSPAYQKIQYKFWDSVETFDPNAIAVKDHTLDINLP